MFIETVLARSLRMTYSGSIALSLGFLTLPVFAQQTSTESPVPQRIEITGSSIRRADAETPSPVQLISAEDLKKSGYTSISQVLQNITANGQGTLSQGFSQAFAAGASGISLRGLTTSATLVLIDGHRMAPYPLADDAQRSFVDISNIPFDTVERIEILKDGASAIYGSDAMAGVVNIILKKSFIGTTASAEAGTSQAGGGETVHASVTHGWGDFNVDGYNAYGSIEYRHQDRITYNQRAGAGSWQRLDWSGIGGTNKTLGVPFSSNQPATYNSPYLSDPNNPYGPTTSAFYPGSCNYNLQQAGGCAYQSPLAELSPETQNVNILASFAKNLGSGWRLDVKGSLFESKAEQYPAGGLQYFPQAFNPIVAVSAGVLPHLVGAPISTITVPANYPGNTLGIPALLNGAIPNAPIPNTQLDSKAYRLVADVTGTLGEWDISSSLGYTKIDTTQNVYGSINIPAFNDAINRVSNPYLPVGPISAADAATLFPSTSARDTSKLEFAELHATRTIMKLQGGDMGISFGGSYIRRELNSPAPTLVAQGIVNGNNAYASGKQTNTSVYSEIVAPVFKSLEIDGAVRLDHFDNAGNSITPKVGFKYTPSESFALRGTYSTGFRAPNSAESGQSGTAFLAGTGNDPVLCSQGVQANGNPYAGEVISACNYQAVTLAAANSKLQPEKSKSATLGVILEPIKGWSTTVDLYRIEIDNQIISGAPDGDAVRAPTPVQTLCADGNGGSYPCTPTVGVILYTPNTYINANSTKTSGIELDTRYKFKLGDYGDLTTDLNWSHTMSYILTTGGVAYQLAGTHGPFVVGGDTGNPKDRVQATVTWDKGGLQVTTAFNYIGGYSLTDPSFGYDTCAKGGAANGWFPTGNIPSQYCQVKSFLDTDVTVRYKFDKHLTLHASVTNLFNAQPPLDFNTYGGGQLPFNPSLHLAGAIGRFFNVGLNYTF